MEILPSNPALPRIYEPVAAKLKRCPIQYSDCGVGSAHFGAQTRITPGHRFIASKVLERPFAIRPTAISGKRTSQEALKALRGRAAGVPADTLELLD